MLYLDYRDIGKMVRKVSGGSFKSKLYVNTIMDVIMHPKTNKLAYLFEEDTSYVEAWKCQEITGLTKRDIDRVYDVKRRIL